MKRILFFLILCCIMSSCRTTKIPEGDPDYFRSAQRGYIAFAYGDTLRALSHYQNAMLRALELDDTALISEASYNTAACRFALRKYDEAKTDCELSTSIQINADNSLLLARIALKRNDPDAEALARQAKLQAPESSDQEASQVLAATLLAVGKLDAAEGILKNITPSSNKSLQARIKETEGDLYVSRNLPEDALVSYTRAEALYAETVDPFARYNVLLRAAELYRQIEDYEKASELLLRAARIGAGIEIDVKAVLDEATQTAVKSANSELQKQIRLFANWLKLNRPS